MEPSLFVPLGEQEHLKEFFNTMRENGRKDAAEDMEQLIACVKEMQEDLSDAMEEIDFLQQQIKDMQDSTMKAKLQKAPGRDDGFRENGLSEDGRSEKRYCRTG